MIEGTEVTSRPRGEHIKTVVNRWRASRRRGMLGVPEIVALTGSALILLTVLFSYFYFLLPARSQLAALQLERARLQTELRNSQEAVHQGQTTEESIAGITDSVGDFERAHLRGGNQGRMDLYSGLNELIRKNGLRNTSGPTYVPLDPAGQKTNTRAANAKWQTVYPGIEIGLTVEGPYQNLRRFIRDVELSKQFLIINSLELERANASASSDSSGSRASLVSLRMDMATYFQRVPGDQNEAPPTTGR